MIIAELPWGRLESYDDNEIVIISTIRDPPKLRVCVDTDKVESNLGSISFNLRRPDGRLEEYIEIMGRLTADKQEGALYIGLRPRGEQSCREFFYLDPHTLVSRVPITAPNLTGGGAVSLPRTIALRSRANGKLLCVDLAQMDGRGEPKTVANRTDPGEWEMFDVVIVE